MYCSLRITTTIANNSVPQLHATLYKYINALLFRQNMVQTETNKNIKKKTADLWQYYRGVGGGAV